MPQLIKLPKDEAEKTLTDLGLTMKVVEQENSVLAPGIVTAQSIPEGTLAEQGSIITVTVTKAPAPEPTPSESATPKPSASGGKKG